MNKQIHFLKKGSKGIWRILEVCIETEIMWTKAVAVNEQSDMKLTVISRSIDHAH